MIVNVFRVLLIIAILFLLYTAFKYYHNPYRKLRKAKQMKEFFFVDEQENIKKNFQFVFNGCFFEGEKYLGSTDDKFIVATIHIIVHDPDELTGIKKEDLFFLEEKIAHYYPHAVIKWKYPINQLLDA